MDQHHSYSDTDQRPPRILVVDDSLPNVLLMGRALEGLGTIRFATGGVEALALAEEDPPDLVMLDIQMPGMDGYEVCRRLKESERCRHCAIIFVTAHDVQANEEISFAAGGVDFIAKPFNIAICRLRAMNQLLLKQRTDALRRARSVVDDLMDNLPALVAYWDDSACNLYCNDVGGRWFGAGADALRGKPIERLIPGEAGAAARGAVELALRQRAVNVQLTFDAEPFGRRVIQLSAVPSFAHQDRPGVLTLITDISDLKSAEAQLELLATSVSHLNDVVMITEGSPLDEPGPRIVFVNRAFERMTGYSREEALGRSPRLLQGPLTDRAELTRIGAALRAGHSVRAEVVNYHKSGRTYWVEMEVVPIPGSGGGAAHLVAIERDISARRESEARMRESNQLLEERVLSRTRELEEARDDAQRANREKSEYLTNISHELRSPLHSILGFTKLLAEDHTELEADLIGGYLARVQGNAETLLRLVNDLLDSAKLETGRFEILCKSVLPGVLCREVMDEFTVECGRRRILLALEDRLPEAVPIQADPLRFAQSLRNVLANAIRFSPEGSEVRLELDLDGGHWLLTVSDQGVGIPPSELNSIFERFTQSTSTKTGAGGTGLGLPIARGIVELHGGQLWAERAEPRGARFVFRLPCRPQGGNALN